MHRYVQEWLACMTAKGIVQYEDESYSLPASERVQKAVLTSAVLPMFADCLSSLESVMRDRSENLKCKSSCAGIHNSLLIKIIFSFLLYMCLRKHIFICKNSILKFFKYFKQKISTLNR